MEPMHSLRDDRRSGLSFTASACLRHTTAAVSSQLCGMPSQPVCRQPQAEPMRMPRFAELEQIALQAGIELLQDDSARAPLNAALPICCLAATQV